MPNLPVFTSYAQLDRDAYLEKFVDEFRKELRALTGAADVIAMAFFDRDGIQAGDRWSLKVLDAVNGADVLLCLMSPTYFTREWCGRELETFLQRQNRLPPAAAQGRFIFPIWWQVPPVPRPLPSRLGAHHFKDTQFPPTYETVGVRGLARQRRWTQFRQIVDRLASLVAETLARPHRLPPGEAVAKVEDIANAFDEQQPYDVRMLALTSGGNAWRPSTEDLTIADAAAETARLLLVFVRKVESGAGLQQFLEKAQTEQQVVLVIVDAAAVPDAVLQMINDLNLPNLALLLVDVRTPAKGGDAWLGQLPGGAFAKAKAAGMMRVAGTGEMRAQMERLVDDARRRLQAGAPTAKAQDSSLVQSAHAQGIATDVQPNLAGPGGGDQP